MNKQYTFSLPMEIAKIIDAIPLSERSIYIAEAVIRFTRQQSQEKEVDVMTLLKQPIKHEHNT